MRDDLQHPMLGGSVAEWIRDTPLSIEDDHVSLWGILSPVSAFGLDAEERVEFARRCIRSLLDAGAVPVVFTGKDSPYFERTDRFGTARDEIVENVIADWLASGGGDLEWGAYPFTYEENFDPYGWPKGGKNGELSRGQRFWQELRRRADERGH